MSIGRKAGRKEGKKEGREEGREERRMDGWKVGREEGRIDTTWPRSPGREMTETWHLAPETTSVLTFLLLFLSGIHA